MFAPVKLAVVIPAYKDTFFRRTLDCLVAQTDRAFKVYVGDDCSPHALKSIVDDYRGRLDLAYTRFEHNIGAKRLVEQWERCMTLIGDEDWIWFFSDDDLASPSCVETFRRYQRTTRGDVYRFNTCTIDEHDRQTAPTVPSPDFESSEEMALNLLLGRRGNSMPDHVFSRAVYEKHGFVHTPFAQAADWATSILFSQEKGMHVLQEGLVSWRRAGASISANVAKHRRETILGHYRFIEWLLEHFRYLERTGPRHGVAYADIAAAALDNMRNVLIFHYRGLPPAMYLGHLAFMRKTFGLSPMAAQRHLADVVTFWARQGRWGRLAKRAARFALRHPLFGSRPATATAK